MPHPIVNKGTKKTSIKPHYLLLPLLLISTIANSWSAPARKAPHIGYLFPAGGKQASTFSLMAGGQLLRGASDVYISGKGVHASIIRYYRPVRNLMKEQRQELLRQLLAIKKKRLAEIPSKNRPQYRPFPGERWRSKRKTKGNKKGKAKGKNNVAKTKKPESTGPVTLPPHPLLENLEQKSLRELYHVVDTFMNFRELKKKQLNRQLMEMVLIKVTIDHDAKPGDRELRFKTPLGLTHPICFQVGTLPEICEFEPNDTRARTNLPEAPPIKLPVVINGQIMPGDVDRFKFHAKRGQKLVIKAHARSLIPFLPDAVPGWFQATLTLYNAKGREVSFADDYHFKPDPVLRYLVPEDGVYELEIRDAIYRGREDFVYRIDVGELPFIERMFPLGAQTGSKRVATVYGSHLSNTRLKLNTKPGSTGIRNADLPQGKRTTNEVLYAIDDLPESNETEPNNDNQQAQAVQLPRIINGRINQQADVDVFKFEGHRGEEIVVEVNARRLHSPLDSLIRISDPAGNILAWNDDNVKKEGHLHRDMGTLTHHADSYLLTKLPKDGTYYVSISDSRAHGSKAHAYRLRISRPRPDFVLHVSPSSLTIPPSGVVVLTAHALRKDGFQGDINVLLKNAPPGFVLSGNRIPFGRTHVRMTLSASGKPLKQTIALQLEGRACITPVQKTPSLDEETVVRPAIPADDVMQAFLWRHLVPTRQLLVAFSRGGYRSPIRIDGTPAQIPLGGWTEVRIRGPKSTRGRKILLELVDPPKGISIKNVRYITNGIALQLEGESKSKSEDKSKIKGKELKAGHTGNLIVQASVEYKVKSKKGDKAPARTRRHTLGVLPAIPFVITPPPTRNP